jgi:hypothetical protein
MRKRQMKSAPFHFQHRIHLLLDIHVHIRLRVGLQTPPHVHFGLDIDVPPYLPLVLLLIHLNVKQIHSFLQ